MYALSPTGKYVEEARKLNRAVMAKLEKQHKLLEENPFHPLLHTKPLKGELSGLFSFRVGRDYRGIFAIKMEKKIIELLRIGSRTDIYR